MKACRNCAHRDADRGLICHACTLACLRDLTTIERAWNTTTNGPVTTHQGGGTERPLPGGVEWLDWRHGKELRGLLTAWAQAWHQDAPVDLPWPPTTITHLLTWLRQHLEPYGVTQDGITDFIQEINGWARRASTIAGHTPTGEVVICPGLDAPCGRRLRVDITRPDDTITCRNCNTEWTAARLLFHGVTGSTDAWVDAEAIYTATGIPPRTLRHWAAQGKVQRRSGRYLLREVYEARFQRT